MRYVLDTNVFNRVLDGFDLSAFLPSSDLVATHIQSDEIAKTPDEARRTLLQQTFAQLVRIVLPTNSAVWDVSRWDQAGWREGPYFDSVLAGLEAHRRRINNREDALIAEVALAASYTLVTADRALADVVEALGGLVLRLA